MKIKLSENDLEPVIIAIKERMEALAQKPQRSAEEDGEISALARVAKGAGVTLRIESQSDGKRIVVRGA